MTESTNVDLVRSLSAAWERGDYSSLEWAHSEIEFAIVDGPSPGHWTGVQDMAVAWRDFLGAWESHRAVADTYRELDDGRVVVVAGATGRGKTSGMTLGGAWVSTSVFEIRGGRVASIAIHLDSDRALADLGIAPEGRAP